mmetsp:Transcript_75438/g.208165  ORF Transcript_75438/g.208165 Transcript_75438/m.208165 type:complete len:276 (-) Transcript_75438:135-962(-)
MDEDGGPRVGLIRSAIRAIRSGTREIDMVFSEARGPLSKAAVRGLHQRIKELRKTAEAAEGAFRDWTLDLAGRPRDAEHAEHDELRRTFEAQVAAVQLSMTRIAGEVKRRKAAKKAGADDPAVESEAGEAEVPPPPQPEPPLQVAAVALAVPAPAPTRNGPVRTAEERASSHAAMASALKLIASQEEEVRLDRSSKQESHAAVWTSPRPRMPMKEKMAGMHPYMKYIVGVALVIVGYTLYSHARVLVVMTAGSVPHAGTPEALEAVPPAPPRRLR